MCILPYDTPQLAAPGQTLFTGRRSVTGWDPLFCSNWRKTINSKILINRYSELLTDSSSYERVLPPAAFYLLVMSQLRSFLKSHRNGPEKSWTWTLWSSFVLHTHFFAIVEGYSVLINDLYFSSLHWDCKIISCSKIASRFLQNEIEISPNPSTLAPECIARLFFSHFYPFNPGSWNKHLSRTDLYLFVRVIPLPRMPFVNPTFSLKILSISLTGRHSFLSI